MALTNFPLDQIDEAKLGELISAGARESLYIDFKSDTYGNSENDHAEFLRDICSFANTMGGDLVIGMTESAGVPSGLSPFTGNADAERLRLEQMARSGVDPRIQGMQTHIVNLSSGGAVLIVRVPRSYNPPHQITYRGRSQFYARSSGGKYRLNVEELRRLFNQAPELAARVRDFRADRIAKIMAGETPVPVPDGALLVLHVVPYSTFGLGHALNLSQIETERTLFPPLGRDYSTERFANFDGFVGVSHGNGRVATAHAAYVQVLRNGAVEGVRIVSPDHQGHIGTVKIEESIIPHARLYAHGLQACGISPPFAVMPSLLRVGNASFITGGLGNASFPETPLPSIRDHYSFVESLLEAVPADNRTCAPLLKLALDHIAGLAGQATSPSFDDAGNYRL